MRKLLFCLFFLCFPWLWLRAQQRIAFARLPPFERAVVCVKFFEGFHGKGCYPYVGYGHQLQKGEHFSSNMPEWQADSLLRADLMAQFDRFKCYGKDALLLSLLAYNIGDGRILGYGKQPKSRLLRKIESGDKNIYGEYVSFCRYKGKVLRGLVKRRQVEFALFYLLWLSKTPLTTFLCSARGVFLSFYLTFSLWMSSFAVKLSLYAELLLHLDLYSSFNFGYHWYPNKSISNQKGRFEYPFILEYSPWLIWQNKNQQQYWEWNSIYYIRIKVYRQVTYREIYILSCFSFCWWHIASQI